MVAMTHEPTADDTVKPDILYFTMDGLLYILKYETRQDLFVL